MATASTAIAGKCWSLSGKVLTLFGEQVWLDSRNTMYVGVWPIHITENLVDRIVEIIQADKAAGNGDKIDHVRISYLGGAQLFIEGLLTKEVLEAANEVSATDADMSYVEVTIPIDGEDRKVRIYNALVELATIDAAGMVV